MRVLILTYEFPPLGGGAGNAIAELVRGLDGVPNLEVVVVTSSVGEYRVERNEFTFNSTIYYLSIGKHGGNIHYQTNFELLKYNIQCYRFVRKLLATEAFDICHAFMTVPAGFNAWLVRKQVPYIVSLQGSDVPWYCERFKLMYHVLTPVILRIWKDSLGVIANSRGLRDLALESAPLQDVDVITNGVDRRLFSPGQGATATDDLRIICVGRLIERKGVWELLDAMPTVLEQIPNAHLDLAGGGKLQQALSARVAELGLDANVTLHGSVAHDQLPVLLRGAALFALPSHAEGMSNALLEGISCGLPVVVTDTGGTEELVEGNGLVVPIKDIPALAAAIVAVLSNDEERKAMGEASLRVADNYSWDQMAQSYQELYRQRRQADGLPAAVRDR